ncbi:putative uncharacterized protein DDB_G0289963, partial [Mercenaria mercenaria]|uniref:putative uncharacterized protein DDB_G0289963 n=1 Tax=Mercenaria mercenaria TaxID=6596 RepID=UPI00234FB36A
DNTEDKWSISAREILLHTVSAVLWIGITFVIGLVIFCSCENTCDCCVGLPLGIVFGILFFTHLVLWFILLRVLYNRKGKGDTEGDTHFKTKLEKVRFIFSTIPFVGLFPVCGWLIRIYHCGNCTIHVEQLTTEKKKHQLLSVSKPKLTNTKTEETGKQNSKRDKKERKKEWDKIHQFVSQAIGSSEKDNQVSASDVKPIETDTEEHSRSLTSGENSTKRKAFMKGNSEVKINKQKSQKENSEFTNSRTKQLSQNNENIINSSQELNIERKQNVSDSQNHISYFEETPQGMMDVTETTTESENKPGSKDDVKFEKKKSRNSEDESKNPENTNMVSAEAHTGKMAVTETKIASENKPGRKDNVKRGKKKSRKSEDENKNSENTNMVSEEAHTGDIDVTTTGSEDKIGSSDNDNPSNSSMSGNALPRRMNSGKENTQNKNGSETMKRALSAIFHDEQDNTTTIN